MIASILCVFLACIAVINAQTACLPRQFCSNVGAIAGRFATAQDCINACPRGTWASYATMGTGWCGCSTTCSSTVPNPDYNTFCPPTPAPSFRPTATPTAVPTATPTARPTARPTASPTAGYTRCHAQSYCSYNMNIVSGRFATPAACAVACTGQRFFTYVPATQWCACAPAGGCSNRVSNPNADTYCFV